MFDTHMIVFTHVPKNGGTSLCQDLKRNFGRQHYFRVEGPIGRTTASLDQKARDAIYVLTGHFRYENEHVDKIDKRPLYIATVRDPIDRIASYHSYFQRKAALKGNDNVYAGFGLNEAVEKMIADNHPFTRADQCKFLSGHDNIKSAKRNIDTNYLAVVPMTSVNKLSNLIVTTFFGDAAKVDSSTHANKSSSNREAIDPKLIEILRERTRDDRRLMTWVAEREEETLARAEARLQDLISRFGAPDFSDAAGSEALRKIGERRQARIGEQGQELGKADLDAADEK